MSKEIGQAGKARRDKAVSMAMKRKEEYLGARVPKELRDRVIQTAKEMGIPVSILIRNTLEDAFGMGPPARAPSSASKETPADADIFNTVLGWEKIQLNKTVSCLGCGTVLQQGKKAFLGLGASEPVVICDACKGHV
ncbi:hypothetical protein Tel_02735 [Candidatus Tenderia electrophaga]|jgi:hypothetical protein|uniref:Uncharacterized protein n=1 Tax=Candidatus Tenderia electrophaga TaxID=1748243 RepID=A0A0S2TAH7_9GAMM|nr:hypothetical protein Tel_02735 [Candidatus Tenderia electrophaga]